jgi:hypothetical protein
MQVGQLALDVDPQQRAGLASTKTVGEQSKKHPQLPAQRGNLFERHLDDPP